MVRFSPASAPTDTRPPPLSPGCQHHRVRVVAGTAKGRKLTAPPGRDVRPTSDRVREAVFSSLVSMDAVEGASVLDLFAGSGALGIEALSRGAATATFVDDDPQAVATVEANLVATGLDGGTVVRADALRWLESAPRLDLALVDPPYEFAAWDQLLGRLRAGVLVAESDHELDLGAGWGVVRIKRYGGTVVTLAARE